MHVLLLHNPSPCCLGGEVMPDSIKEPPARSAAENWITTCLISLMAPLLCVSEAYCLYGIGSSIN